MASHISYRPDIDGLRAIAVLGVLFCHAGLGLQGGYVGVDVFFVISGYLITSLIVKELQQQTFSLANFWERRIRRIVPALLVVTITTIMAGWFLLTPVADLSFGKSLAAMALLVSNVQFWRETGYFEAAAETKPLLHTWSLAVEEQFYLFVPLFLLLLARFSRLDRARALLLLATIVSFSVSIYGTYHFPGATFYLLPTRAWELFVGALLVFFPVTWGGRLARYRELAAAAGLALVLLPCILYDHTTRFPGLAALPPVLGTALLIFCGNGLTIDIPAVNRCLVWPPLVAVGLISYSLYLWHWPLFAFGRSLSIVPLSTFDRLVLVGASIILAALSWCYVERPFRSRRIFASRPRLMALATMVFVGVLCSGLAVYYGNGVETRFPAQARLFASTGERDSRFMHESDVQDVPRNLLRFGDNDASPEVLIWGDSHAMAILPAIEALCQKTGTTACAATHSATPPVIGYFRQEKYGLNERAIAFNAAVLDFVQSEKIPTVVLVAVWSSYFKDAKFPAALLNTVDTLQEKGVTVYFMKDVPMFAFDVPKALVVYSILGRHFSGLALAEDDYEALNQFHSSFLPALMDRGVKILDPIPFFQASGKSSDILPADSSGSFYTDRQHLSTYGAITIKPLLAPLFKSVDSDG